MEKKKVEIKTVAANTGKAASELFGKAKKTVVKAIDRNDDGELNLRDVTFVTDQWSEKREQLRQESERKNLSPIFAEDLVAPEFVLPKMIRITEMDKKHLESELCKGSIGHSSVHKDLRIINIYTDKVDEFGLTFYPDRESEIYYVDPSDRNRYIALDDYFNYLKIVRVNELQRIAQDLGAKHFRVTYMEQKKTFSEKKGQGKATGRGPMKAETQGEHEGRTEAFSKVEIAAEMDCPGHDPVEPELVYLKKDPNIQTLIAMRMARNSPTHQKVAVSLSNSSGIKVKDAIKIDAALGAMKITGNATVTSEAQSEARRFLEYEIDF